MIEPHLPPAHGTGRPRSWPMREIVNGIFYVMRAGCPWRLLPSDLPPWGTIYRWFAKFRDDGLLEKINHSLVMADRERVGREASPSGRDYRQPERHDDRGWWPPRLRCGQEDQGAQAPRAGRHRRARPRARGASGEYPGPRWWRAAAVRLTRLVSVHREGLCRQRLRRREGRHGHRDSPSRSCAKAPIRSASPSNRAAGSWSASSPGSTATGDWQRTSRPPSPRPAPSSTPPPSCSSSADWPEPHDFRNRL